MTDVYQRRPIRVRARRWTGKNEAEVRELCPHFYAVAEEDRANSDDPDATAEAPVGRFGNSGPVYDGDWIVEHRVGGWVRMTHQEFTAEYKVAS